jgi:hypothetical protein
VLKGEIQENIVLLKLGEESAGTLNSGTETEAEDIALAQAGADIETEDIVCDCAAEDIAFDTVG